MKEHIPPVCHSRLDRESRKDSLDSCFPACAKALAGRRRNDNIEGGFLATEMFLVVALALVIFTGAIYGFMQAKIYSRDNRRVSDLKQIANALMLYQDAQGSYPADCGWSTDACWVDFLREYMKRVPKDPLNRTTGQCEEEAGCFVYRYCRLNEGRSFVVITNLEKPKKNATGNNPGCPLGGPNQHFVTN